SYRAAGIIASDCIDATTDQFGHIKPVFYPGDDLARRLFPGLQKEVSVPDPGIPRDAARRIACRLHFQLARRVGVEQVVLQNPFLDHRRSPRGYAFVIERLAAE